MALFNKGRGNEDNSGEEKYTEREKTYYKKLNGKFTLSEIRELLKVSDKDKQDVDKFNSIASTEADERRQDFYRWLTWEKGVFEGDYPEATVNPNVIPPGEEPRRGSGESGKR